MSGVRTERVCGAAYSPDIRGRRWWGLESGLHTPHTISDSQPPPRGRCGPPHSPGVCTDAFFTGGKRENPSPITNNYSLKALNFRGGRAVGPPAAGIGNGALGTARPTSAALTQVRCSHFSTRPRSLRGPNLMSLIDPLRPPAPAPRPKKPGLAPSFESLRS